MLGNTAGCKIKPAKIVYWMFDSFFAEIPGDAEMGFSVYHVLRESDKGSLHRSKVQISPMMAQSVFELGNHLQPWYNKVCQVYKGLTVTIFRGT